MSTETRARLQRCRWAEGDPLMSAYHDDEWGIPERDSRALWEKLVLDGFQAGLSWRTVLYKRGAFRHAFEGFHPEQIARYSESDIERLLGNAGIIRSRAKIAATIGNARAYLNMRESGEEFSDWVWQWVDGTPLAGGETIPAQTPLSVTIAKALKQRGFSFAGPVVVYAWMQAVGLVNDHTRDCFRHPDRCAYDGADHPANNDATNGAEHSATIERR